MIVGWTSGYSVLTLTRLGYPVLTDNGVWLSFFFFFFYRRRRLTTPFWRTGEAPGVDSWSLSPCNVRAQRVNTTHFSQSVLLVCSLRTLLSLAFFFPLPPFFSRFVKPSVRPPAWHWHLSLASVCLSSRSSVRLFTGDNSPRSHLFAGLVSPVAFDWNYYVRVSKRAAICVECWIRETFFDLPLGWSVERHEERE